MANLTDLIRSEIAKDGPISFDRYMSLALYHPTLGYYRSGRDPFGKHGDFFTAAQLGPVFGETIRAFIAGFNVATSSCSEPLRVIDLGAGRAELGKALSGSYNYQALEIPDDLPGQLHSAVIIANEFFDALPVRRVHRPLHGQWREVLVHWHNDRFEFIDSGLDLAPELQRYLDHFGMTIAPGNSLEISLETDSWLKRLRQSLRCGCILIIDYGYNENEWQRFSDGSLMSYHKHQASSEVLAEPGMRDITSHVNWSWLTYLARLHGFRVARDCFLSEFVIQVWESPALQDRLAEAAVDFKTQWKSLVFGMGETFRVVMLEPNNAR